MVIVKPRNMVHLCISTSCILVTILSSWAVWNPFLQVKESMYVVYVDDDNSSGLEDGTPENPFNTIQEGVDAATERGKVMVMSGNYDEYVKINKSLSVIGESRATVQVVCREAGYDFPCFHVQAENLTLEHLTFKTYAPALRLVYAHGVIVNDTSFELSSTDALTVDTSSDIVIKNSIFLNNDNSLLVFDSKNIQVQNVSTANTWNGVAFCNSRNVLLLESDVSGYSPPAIGGIGVVIHNSSNIEVRDNRIHSASYGVQIIFWSNSVLLENNNISSNVWGVHMLQWVANITVQENLVENNTEGFHLGEDVGARIFHNNIIENGKSAVDLDPANTSWYDALTLEGNYWSDYTGVDDGSGSGRHSIKGDGIGDTQIPHPGHGFDYYPFVEADGWFKNPSAPISISLSIHPETLNHRSKGRWITAYLSAENASIQDINVSSILLQDTLKPERFDFQEGVLMLKFNRQDLQSLLVVSDSVQIRISGKWKDGTYFEAFDHMRVIDRGKE